MGLALVCISTVEPQLYRPYGTGTSLYNIQWNLSYTDPMGLALVKHPYYYMHSKQ